MNNKIMAYEEYKREVFRHLKEFGNFQSPSEEAKAYMESDEVNETIMHDYEYGNPAEGCAWGIDIMY